MQEKFVDQHLKLMCEDSNKVMYYHSQPKKYETILSSYPASIQMAEESWTKDLRTLIVMDYKSKNILNAECNIYKNVNPVLS